MRLFCPVAGAFLLCPLLLNGPLSAQRVVRPADRIVTAIDDRFSVARPGDRHPLARIEFDEGAVAPEFRLERMVLSLVPDREQEQALEEFLASQQDVDSADYHRWLTPEEFGARFGISENDLNQVVHWLEGHGFVVEPVAPSRRSIVFSGTAAQVAAAFHTEVHQYKINGQRHHANATAPRIPEALASVVRGIVSLHDFAHAPQHIAAAAAIAAEPDYTSGGSHYVVPADFATIYDVAPLYAASIDGTGQSVAIIGRTNISLDDVNKFRSTFGLSTKPPTIVLNGSDPGIISSGEEMEALLDVEWSGAVAKNAAIQLIVSASTAASDGVDLSAQYAVNHNVAPVVSLSFGSCEAAMGTSENQFWNGLWQQAASQGMTVLVSAGDSGAAGCDDPSSTKASYGKGINGLCSSPYSTCVGGTGFDGSSNTSVYWSASNNSSYGSAVSYIPETVWNESANVSGGSGLWAGGGGASIIYAKPSWQAGAGVPSDGHRDVPDVSLNASMANAVLVCLGGSFYQVGGTSVAAPEFAGVMGVAVQNAGSRLGNVNPAFYGFATRQANGGAAVFHDVAKGNNSVPGVTGFTAAAGYDQGTGLGSVDVAALFRNWNGTTSTPSFQIGATPASITLTPGASATSSIKLTLSGQFNSAVALTAAGMPAGVTASFQPATIAAGSTSSTLTLTASSQAAATTANITISGVGGGLTETAVVALTVPAACSYAINPSAANATSAAANYTVQVTAASGCAWTAKSGVSWITVTGGASGSGNGTVSYSVATNTATASRSGSIAIAGLSLGVTQAAAGPQFSLSPTSASFPAAAAKATVVVTSSSTSATWIASSQASWITITSGASGASNRNVAYSITANATSAARTGTMTIAGMTFTVTQAGVPCSYALNPTSASITADAKAYSVQVTATAGCAWTAATNSSFLTVASGNSGTGSGTVSWSATVNTGAVRSGALTIAGITFPVTQAAAAATAPKFSLSPSSASAPAAGTKATVAVTSSSSTATWTAASNASWIAITTGAANKGSGTVAYTVAANSATASRTGTLTIAGLTFTVTQAGAAPAAACSYSLGTATNAPIANGSSLTFPVSAGTGCAWTATSNASWLPIASGASGTGSGKVVVDVMANNTGVARTGTVVIAGITISITESK